MKNTWSVINKILNRQNNPKFLQNYFIVEGTTITDPKSIANSFNDFFINVGPKLESSISAPSDMSFKDFLNDPIEKTINYFTPIKTNDVIEIINSLKPKSSQGMDCISSKLLKFVKHEISEPIRLIINHSFECGVFPDLLKIAKVLPIHKKNEKEKFDNYRPISILPSISKIFEKAIYSQIYNHFHDNNLFMSNQYGFRKQHSTTHALLEIVEYIIKEMDKMNIPINIYMDLSKAFDTLNHDILLEKLSFYGIQDKAKALMSSYISNRKQYVEFNNTTSNLMIIKTGVPQGSILGPLLFIIYLNDIKNVTKRLHPVTFADDTTLITTLNSFRGYDLEKEINYELEQINNWFRLNNYH
jgi:hypothetical protein